jgi:hypothetical protein
MSEWAPLIAAFWAALLLDCVKIFPARWRRVFITGAWGRTPRLRPRTVKKTPGGGPRQPLQERTAPGEKIRAVASGQCARAVFAPPLPVSWQAFADDLPFSFSPEGVCNVTVGSVARESPQPDVARCWKWEDIRSVEKKGARLWVNERDFCMATPCADAAGLWALARRCAGLAPGARARHLEQTLHGWFRPASLRRSLARVGARTSALAFFASINAVIALAFSAYFLGGGPEIASDPWSGRIARMLPMAGLYAAVVHGAALAAGWRAHRKLLPGRAAQRVNMLAGPALLPPLVFRLRAQIAAAALPAQHPLVWFAVAAGEGAFRKRAARVLRDLRWPLAPARNPDPQITARVLQWMRARMSAEIARLLASRGVSADELLAPPEPDGPESRSYCPRCRDQFTKTAGRCPCGTELAPLGKTNCAG